MLSVSLEFAIIERIYGIRDQINPCVCCTHNLQLFNEFMKHEVK